MTGAELREIRKALYGEGDNATAAFATALGLAGRTDASLSASLRRLEAMWRVPGWFARLATIYCILDGTGTTDETLHRIERALQQLNNRGKSKASLAS